MDDTVDTDTAAAAGWRSWTPEAAREPLPPLAPPPARAGAGRSIEAPPRLPASRSSWRAVIAVLAAAGVILVVLLAFLR